jgi:hypothetical protein
VIVLARLLAPAVRRTVPQLPLSLELLQAVAAATAAVVVAAAAVLVVRL